VGLVIKTTERSLTMRYKYVTGPVFCRYAATPPIVNAKLAEEYGIEARSFVELEQQRNVKVTILLEDRTKRMTCHAKVAWVKRDETAGGAFDERWTVGLNNLSFTDAEFEVLLKNLVEAPECPLEVRDRVRDATGESTPVTFPETELQRVKAVTMPVTLIDEIDSKRGDVSFSPTRDNGRERVLERSMNGDTLPGIKNIGLEPLASSDASTSHEKNACKTVLEHELTRSYHSVPPGPSLGSSLRRFPHPVRDQTYHVFMELLIGTLIPH
jgi:hypothetical protein